MSRILDLIWQQPGGHVGYLISFIKSAAVSSSSCRVLLILLSQLSTSTETFVQIQAFPCPRSWTTWSTGECISEGDSPSGLVGTFTSCVRPQTESPGDQSPRGRRKEGRHIL